MKILGTDWLRRGSADGLEDGLHRLAGIDLPPFGLHPDSEGTLVATGLMDNPSAPFPFYRWALGIPEDRLLSGGIRAMCLIVCSHRN